MAKLLVVDDERSIGEAIREALFDDGHHVEITESAEMALAMMRRSPPDLLLTDIRLEGMNGLELLAKTREHFPQVHVILMTAAGTIDIVVSAMKQGAYDFLIKPFNLDQLQHVIERFEKVVQLKQENLKLRHHIELLANPTPLVSKNAKVRKLMDIAQRVAQTDSTLLVTGQSGTGKTMLAKLIHDSSVRASGPFSVVNCATLSENLLESELFGHVRGSFTGAVRDKIGRLQVADTGTVFLDEIGEISPNLQTKLLRFLQEREFEKVGDTKTIKVDVRIIAATNKDLEREVVEGHFREDLYFRLNVIELHMPSLKDRPEDLPDLIGQLLSHSFAMIGRPTRPVGADALKALLNYPWPGNIRELKNALERAAILSTTDEIRIEDLPDRVVAFSEPVPVEAQSPQKTVVPLSPHLSLDAIEKMHIQSVLSHTRTLEEAAELLGINLSTLWRKRRQYGMDWREQEISGPEIN